MSERKVYNGTARALLGPVMKKCMILNHYQENSFRQIEIIAMRKQKVQISCTVGLQ